MGAPISLDGKLSSIANDRELSVILFTALLRETRFQHLTVTFLTSQVSQIGSLALLHQHVKKELAFDLNFVRRREDWGPIII